MRQPELVLYVWIVAGHIDDNDPAFIHIAPDVMQNIGAKAIVASDGCQTLGHASISDVIQDRLRPRFTVRHDYEALALLQSERDAVGIGVEVHRGFAFKPDDCLRSSTCQ